MKLTMRGGGDVRRSELGDFRTMPVGPDRLEVLIRILEEDVSYLPLSANPPEEVAEAYKAYQAAISLARQVAGEIEQAEETRQDAAEHDVAATAAALSEGASRPKISQLKAAEGITASLVGAEAAERLLEQAHDVLIDVVTAAWASWRRLLVDKGAAAHAVATERLAKAVADVTLARGLYAAVPHLDAEIRSRDPRVAAATDIEVRDGLGWYAVTHTGRPPLGRVRVAVPGQNKPVHVDLVTMVTAIADAIADAPHFAAAEWLPPGDPDHDRLLGEPLDLTAAWVKDAVAHTQGGTRCVLCGQDDAETVVKDGAVLVLVHRRCLDKPPTEPERRRNELLAKHAEWKRTGYPPSPDESMSVDP